MIKRIFRRILERVQSRTAATGGVLALIIGLVSELAGVDIAPTEIDIIMTGVAALLALIERWRAQRVATP